MPEQIQKPALQEIYNAVVNDAAFPKGKKDDAEFIKNSMKFYINRKEGGRYVYDEAARKELLASVDRMDREDFIRALSSPDYFNKWKKTVPRLEDSQNRANALNAVTALMGQAQELANFSDWDNVGRFVQVANNMQATLRTLSSGVNTQYYSKGSSEIPGMKDKIDQSIALLAMSGFLSDADKEKLNRGERSYEDIGNKISNFSGNVSVAVVTLNQLDGLLRDYVYYQKDGGNLQAIQDRLARIIPSKPTDPAGENERACTFAINALYDDVVKGMSVNSSSGNASFGGTDIEHSALEKYVAFVKYMINDNGSRNNRYLSTLRDKYTQAHNVNPQAAEILRDGKPADLLTGAPNVADNVVNPPSNSPNEPYVASRPAYDIFSIIAGNELISKGLPFSTINFDPSLGLQPSLEAYNLIKNTYFPQIAGLLDQAQKGQIDMGDFETQFNNACQSAKAQLNIVSGNASASGNPGVFDMQKGLDFFFVSGHVDTVKAWNLATSNSTADQQNLQNNLNYIRVGMQELENSLYGANPARDFFQNGATMPRGAMTELLYRRISAGSNVPETAAAVLLKKIYPDRYVFDLSTRNQIASALQSYMQSVYSNTSVSERFNRLGEFLDLCSNKDFGTLNLTNEIANQVFGISDYGVIYIKGTLVSGTEQQYSPYGLDVYSLLQSQLLRIPFGIYGQIPDYPAIETGAGMSSQVPWTLRSDAAGMQLYKNSKMQGEFFHKYYFQGLERGYHSDLAGALAGLGDAYDRAIRNREVVPGLLGGMLSGDLALGGSQRGQTAGGGAGQVETTRGTSSSAGAAAGVSTIATDNDTHQAQVSAFGHAADYRLAGNAVVRSFFGNYLDNRNWQPGTIFGYKFQSVSQSMVADLNASAFKNSDLIFHYDRQMSSSSAASESAPGTGSQTSGGQATDYLKAYYRMGGNTWVELIATNDQQRNKLEQVASLLRTESGTISEANNRLAAGATAVGNAQFLGAVQKRSGKQAGENRQAGLIEDTDYGFIVGVGLKNISTAAVAGRTADRESAAAATHREPTWDLDVEYYELHGENVRNFVGAEDINVQIPAGGSRVTRATQDLKNERLEQVAGANVAIGREAIFRAGLAASIGKSAGKGLLGGTMGYQSADYTNTTDKGSLFKSFGFFDWSGTGALRAARYGTEGQFREIDTSYLAQINDTGKHGMKRYTAAIQTKLGENFTVEVTANFTKPEQFYQSLYNSLNNDGEIKQAVDSYITVSKDPAATLVAKRTALNAVSQAMNNVFQRNDGLSVFDMLGNGSLSELTISGGGDDAVFTTTIASRFDPVSGKYKNVTSMVSLSDNPDRNFALIESFNVNQAGKAIGAGGGAIYKAGDFKTLFLLTSVPKGLSPHEYLAEGRVAYKDNWVDVASTGNMYRAQYMNANDDVPFMVNYINVDGFRTIGGKAAVYLGQVGERSGFIGALEMGTSFWKDARKYNIGIEPSWVGERFGKAGTLGIGARYEYNYIPGTHGTNWIGYVRLSSLL